MEEDHHHHDTERQELRAAAEEETPMMMEKDLEVGRMRGGMDHGTRDAHRSQKKTTTTSKTMNSSTCSLE